MALYFPVLGSLQCRWRLHSPISEKNGRSTVNNTQMVAMHLWSDRILYQHQSPTFLAY